MLQCSIGTGWQKGMSSAVRLAAITPAMMAVSNTGPLAVRCPLACSARATAAGKAMRASASATRWVTVLSPTPTIVGRRAASRWVSPALLRRLVIAADASTTDVVHFDACRAVQVNAAAQFAVTISAPQPASAYGRKQFIVTGAGAQRRAQVEPLRGE